MERTGVGDDTHCSEAKAVQVLSIALELGGCHAFLDTARLEEPVEFAADCETEQTAQLGAGQSADAILLRGEGFQGATAKVAIAEATEQIIRNRHDDVHA